MPNNSLIPQSKRPSQTVWTLLAVVAGLTLLIVGILWSVPHFMRPSTQTASTPTAPQVNEATQTANMIQTQMAGGDRPTPALAIPPTPVAGATPAWITVARLYSTSAPGDGNSGQFAVLAHAHARIRWSCDVATNDPTALLGCSAALFDARTGKKVSELVDTNTAASGIYQIPVSSSAMLYMAHISTNNQNFVAYYEVYQ